MDSFLLFGSGGNTGQLEAKRQDSHPGVTRDGEDGVRSNLSQYDITIRVGCLNEFQFDTQEKEQHRWHDTWAPKQPLTGLVGD